MNKIEDINPAQAYMVGMLYAAFGERAFSGDAVEEHIEAAKDYAKKRKEEEIDHTTLTPTEKENQKRLWKEWIDETTKGFKDELKRAGRIVELG